MPSTESAFLDVADWFGGAASDGAASDGAASDGGGSSGVESGRAWGRCGGERSLAPTPRPRERSVTGRPLRRRPVPGDLTAGARVAVPTAASGAAVSGGLPVPGSCFPARASVCAGDAAGIEAGGAIGAAPPAGCCVSAASGAEGGARRLRLEPAVRCALRALRTRSKACPTEGSTSVRCAKSASSKGWPARSPYSSRTVRFRSTTGSTTTGRAAVRCMRASAGSLAWPVLL